MKIRTNILLIILVISAFSCKSKKNIQHVKLKHTSAKTLIDSLYNNQLSYDWLRSKATATIIFQKEKHSIKANFRIRKDSAIWNNLSKGPLQISTALISQDSVKLLKKINDKEYFVGNYDYINKLFRLDMDLELLQDFLTGNPIMFDYESKFKSEVDSNLYLLSSDKSKKIDKFLEKDKYNKKHEILYRCWINPENFKCSKIEVNFLTTETTIVVNYSDWKNLAGQEFPFSSGIDIYTPEDTITMKMEYYDNVKLNEAQSFPFKITDSYSPINVDDQNN